jgi:membrane peptidoglycan carboxypeptidase
LANTLVAGLSKDTTEGTSAAAASAAGWHRPDIGKTGTTNDSESVAYVGGVNGYGGSSMLFADGPHPRTLCPGPPVHLGDCGHGAFGGTVAAPPYFKAMSKILAGQPSQPIPPPDPEFVIDHSGDNHDGEDAGDNGGDNSSQNSEGHHHRKRRHSDDEDQASDGDSRPPSGPVLAHVIAPYTVGDQDAKATAALSAAGYPVLTVPLSSAAPKGQVIGQTPQGNVAKGTPITVYTSTGTPPAPS